MLKSSATIFIQRALDPITAIAILVVLSFFYGIEFDTPYILLAAISFLLILPLFSTVGLYQSFRGRYLGAEVPRIFLGWFMVFAIESVLGYSTQTLDLFSYPLLLSWVIVTPIALSLIHLSIRAFLHRLRAGGHNTRTAVIVGNNSLGQCLAEEIKISSYLGIELIGFFGDSTFTKKTSHYPILGEMHKAPNYVRQNKIDIVYIATQMGKDEGIGSLVEELQDTTASVYFIPSIFVFSLMRRQMQDLNGIPLIAGWDAPFSGVEVLLKRSVDVILASLILVLISPIMIAIAIAVKFSSPGPILFKQRRYGIKGQDIVVYKFRSMTVTEDGEQIIQVKRDDQRVTKIGAFLRKTSLDELPQFINVLQGSMSLVGPRPHAVAHNEQYRRIINCYMLRHQVKPGITGWAQINGYRGETDTLEKMRKRVEYDLQYIRDWSLLLDLQIILKTAFVFFDHKNAY